jgi:hypothetical protein
VPDGSRAATTHCALKHYSQPLQNFDRQVFTVALVKK